MPEHEVKFLAYHIADGQFVGQDSIRWTSGSAKKVVDFRSTIEAFGDSAPRDLLLALGLHDKRAGTKFVPQIIFTLRRPLVALFLNRYLGCDGCVERCGRISFSSASETLARQIAHLLLRFGAFGGLRSKIVNGRRYWEWISGGAESVEAIRREIGVFTKPVPAPAPRRFSHNDRVPIRSRELPDGQKIGRHRASWASRALAQAQAHTGDALHALAHSDVYWDEVRSIRRNGRAKTVDLEVPVLHNFVANDIIAHNTTAVIRALNPRRTRWIATERGALLPALNAEINPSGVVPDFDEALDLVNPWGEAMRLLGDALDASRAGRYDAIVIDTLSSLADREMLRIRNVEKVTDKFGAANRVLRQRILPVVWSLVSAGPMVIAISHDREPSVIDGHITRGGPRLAGDLVSTVPSLFDMVLRCDIGASPTGEAIRVVRLQPLDKKYVDKDRFSQIKDGDPLDLKLILSRAIAIARRM
jgi:hypothetical protein